MIPKWIRENLPEEFETEEQFEQIAKQIFRTYSGTNYRLLGEFEREAVTLPEFKERYAKMDRFEEQCREMEERIEQLTSEVEELKRTQEELKKAIAEHREQLEKEKALFEAYQRENEYYKRIESDNVILTQDNKTL